MKNITIFRNILDTKTPYYVDLQSIYGMIKSGKYKETIEKIRPLSDKKDRDELKKLLPSICFSGIFTSRTNMGITEHSGLVAVDFDHLPDYESFWVYITKDKYTHMAFRSPSGDGVKVIVRIPANNLTHRMSCRALLEYYNNEHLDQFEDVARVCYISYDPNIFWNKESAEFTTLREEKPTLVKEIIDDHDTIYSKLKIWIEKNDVYQDGNKYKFLVRLAAACNRFGIPSETASSLMENDYKNAASPVGPKDFEKIVSRVYRSYPNNFSTMCFESERLVDKKTHVDTSGEILSTEVGINDVITCEDIKADMWDQFHNGTSRGETTYFDEIDEHWTWKKGEVTLVGGIGNHGKTCFVMQLCLIKAVKEGVKWAVFSPEQNPPKEFFDDLIQSYIGKPTEKHIPGRMSDEEYERGMDFIGKHFFYVYPKDAPPTPKYIRETFVRLIVNKGVRGCVIDPFNQLSIDWVHGRDDRVISEFLSYEKRFAIEHNIYDLIIAHPNAGITKQIDGNYSCPDVYDFSGGAMWNNKCDNILQVYRPYYTTDKMNTEVIFKSQKIKKQRLVGIPGDCVLSYDRFKGRYYVNGINPLEQSKQSVQYELEQEEPPF